MQLSIVLPCLDEAEILVERLVALQWLRDQGHELILVDGGSRDASADLAEGLVDTILVSPKGRAGQMNLGARAARGEILWFLHVDTRVFDGADREVIGALGNRPGWGRFDVRLSGSKPALRLVEWMMNLRSRLTGIATGDQGIFVTRELFAASGGYPEIALMEDIEISRRLKRYARPKCIPQPLVTSSRRWERRGIYRTIAKMWGLRLAYFFGADPVRLAARYGSSNEH